MYAVIGAAALLGGVTRMTISLVVIMFEMTGALNFVLPVMVAVMLSKWVGDALVPRDINEISIHVNGYPFLDPHELPPAAARRTPVRDLMMKNLIFLPKYGNTVESLESLASTSTVRGFPVVGSKESMNACVCPCFSTRFCSFRF